MVAFFYRQHLAPDIEEGLDAHRIEMVPATASQQVARTIEIPCFLVGPCTRERVENIGNRDDSAVEGNVMTFQPARIAAAVELLMMENAISAPARRIGEELFARMRSPMTVCCFMISNSSGVSFPGLRRI